MMDVSKERNLILFKGFIFCFFVYFQSTCAQEGFVSIQCCADTKYTDPYTNITYTADNDWYPSGSTCQNIPSEVKSDIQYKKARFFSSVNGNEWCYSLTTAKNQDYLIRGTFPCQDQEGSSKGSFSFDVFIGVTQIGTVNSSNDTIVEGIFTATGDYINFCLEKQYGDPYISRLELRPLSDSAYLNGETSNVLKLIERVDAGSNESHIRFPYDMYDRIWSKEKNLNPNQAADRIFSPSTNATSAESADTTAPPIQVLQTALTHPDRLKFLHPNLDTENYDYALNLYFLELNDTVQPGQRVFDVYINNKKDQEIDILAGGSRYKAVSMNFTANGALNLTLVKASNVSPYGPIINAYEILQVRKWVEGTAQEDVDVILKIRDELLKNNQDNEVFETWSGDPCLPLSWHRVSCETTNNSIVISKLNLSASKIKGPLPPSITKLTHLKELNMSYNDFTGTIPEFEDSSQLTSVDLSHNDLTGNIPNSLLSNPNLKIMYYGCNPQFNKEPTASLNSSQLTTDNGECDGRRSSHHVQHIVVGVVSGTSILVIIAVAVYFACFHKRKSTSEEKFKIKILSLPKNVIFNIPSKDDIIVKSISIQNFTLACIEDATQKYQTLIGEGGFGSVYRGTLSDGQEVAVKVRSATSTQGTREFENELNLLSKIQHENLVPLLGYCCESEQQILVYPFMSNGSLQDRLYGEAAKRKILDWPTRLSIALGAARGLTYLHTFPGRAVIHRDVKSSNILLDHSMCAKVADFGFSKYAPQEGDSGASLEVRGTAGYLDPEYYSTQHLSDKSDVFSFGVVLLEIVSGREPLNIHRPRNEWSLVEWVKPYIKNSKIDEIVDLSIKGEYHTEAVWRVIEVALACIEPFSAYRPCMIDIVRELEDALIIENNASEYMKSIDSFNASTRFNTSKRFSIERALVIPQTTIPIEESPMLSQPPPPQPR